MVNLMTQRALVIFFQFLVLMSQATLSHADSDVEALRKKLKLGQTADIIVEYQSGSVETQSKNNQNSAVNNIDNETTLEARHKAFQKIKERANQQHFNNEVEELRDYSHLPLSFKRVHSSKAFEQLLVSPDIKAVYENRQVHRVLAQSLPLINQPAVSNALYKGDGTAVAVLDDGINYGNAAFGSCTAPGVPASCKVAVSMDFGTGSSNNDHGTNVSAIVTGVAPNTKILMLNVFSGNGAFFSDLIDAINWAIANKSTYNIASLNMSLGDGVVNTTTCASSAMTTPITNAINAGIGVVAAAGNDAFTNGLSSPACVPGVISVGAVYDGNNGGLSWGNGLCTDATTQADKITCFSNSASYLSLLAPGAMITAAGITIGGTSQASPHVAGSLAVLRAAFPTESLSQLQNRLINNGNNILDTRNNITKPRINLLESARPINDDFSSKTVISGATGSITATNLLGSKESGEYNHAGNSGGKSVWWRWMGTGNGQVTVTTHSSTFDTLLAVYTGGNIVNLSTAASNDDDGTAGGVSTAVFQAVTGQQYSFVVDGKNAASGTIHLNWSINTSAQANLGVSVTGQNNEFFGDTSTYTLVASNSGPNVATNVIVTLALPNGAIAGALPNGCNIAANTITCSQASIAAGASAIYVIPITWNTATGNQPLSASINSDVPDSNTANNSNNLLVAVSAGNVDVPTLPQWALLLMTSLCIGFVAKRKV